MQFCDDRHGYKINNEENLNLNIYLLKENEFEVT